MDVVLSGGWFYSETRVNMSWLGVFNVAFFKKKPLDGVGSG
jgi:hypothetical protein